VTWSIFPAIAIRNAAAPTRIIKVQIPMITSIDRIGRLGNAASSVCDGCHKFTLYAYDIMAQPLLEFSDKDFLPTNSGKAGLGGL
jgi:hypothetical protein